MSVKTLPDNHVIPAHNGQTFENDFPALLPGPLPTLQQPSKVNSSDSLFASEPIRGRCKVICFHPKHDLTIARMNVDDVVRVIGEWKNVYVEEGRMLQESSGQGYVQIFEVGLYAAESVDNYYFNRIGGL